MAEYQLVHPENADDRLAEFDLTVAEVHDHVVRAGLQAAGGVSPLAPPGAAGRHAHDGYVAGLRELLVPRGWEIVQQDMVARTVHRERQLAILISGGNEFTALPDGANYLTSAWPKGNCALAGAILPHQDGFEAVDASGFNWASDALDDPEWVVWYLLHHHTETEVRLELSAPTRLDDRDFPRGWTNRIILPPYVLGQVHVNDDQDDDDTGGEPNVPVIPR
ncbi:hypothetical protein [Mycobacterium sp. URHB0044]|uniref:hypothetical protein n=1 Tax=Mycobacterium sp. URHB0044 TaxID=1380386 RepID=UPI00048EADCB|nr:hypothetical protein [Mycobacterium sp. URHB0044]